MNNKEMATIQSQIDQITKRREDLGAELVRTTEGIENRKRSLGSDVLIGKEDSNLGLDALAREERKLGILEEAIGQAKDQIQELNQQLTEKRRQAVLVDFGRVADEAYDLVRTSIDQLYRAVAGLDALDAKFKELNRIGAAAGMNADSDDHLRLAHEMCKYLRGDFGTDEGIPAKLRRIEENYAATLARARAKHIR